MGARRYWCVDEYVADAAFAGPGPFDGARLFVLAADHDRIVAEAEARGWNAGLKEISRTAHDEYERWTGRSEIPARLALRFLMDAIAALRKPEVEG